MHRKLLHVKAIGALVLTLVLFISVGVAKEGSYAQQYAKEDDIAYMLASAAPGAAQNNFWPESAPEAAAVEAAIWAFRLEDIDSNETILSVSPSGENILTVDRQQFDLEKRTLSGIANVLGRQVKHLSVYSRSNGVYTLTCRMTIGNAATIAFQDTLAACGEDGVAWSEDETHALITTSYFHTASSFLYTHSDIYLVDFVAQTFENLTGDDAQTGSMADGGYHHLLPQWHEKDNFTFIRYALDENHAFVASLMNFNLSTKKQELLSDLSDAGRVSMINDYSILDGSVYFCSAFQTIGFYVSKLGGGDEPPVCLLDFESLRANNIHPYMRAFSSVQISEDGRWACLAITDNRMLMRDIPFPDDPLMPQADLSTAKSLMTGEAWVPCHNVMLYDLENNVLVNPFTAMELQPDVVIAAGAAFAPDGKSLLCAVFGDGGVWKPDDFSSKTTLYQIRLDDGSFDAMRLFKTDLPTSQIDVVLSWLGNNALLLKSSVDFSPQNPVQIVMPQAFARFLDAE